MKAKHIIGSVARTLLAITFLFSGFVKAVDPLGTVYKIEDYLKAFGGFFTDLLPLAEVAAIILISVELILGVCMLLNVRTPWTSWVSLLFYLVMTPLTLWIALTNPVSDCGCFGDAIKLTNWQTFWKNIVLDVPTVWIFLTRNIFRKKRFERNVLIMVFAIVIMVIFGVYNINNEPCIDFRPWKVGNQMVDVSDNDEVKSYVTYRNKETGETEEFLSAELVKKMEDPTWEQAWEWESSRVVDPHEIKADGFSMLDMDMNDHAKELLCSDEYLLISTIHHLEKMNAKGIESMQRAMEIAEENGLQMVVLSSALPEDVEMFLYDNKLDNLEFYFADATAIETMLRSNPGFILLKKGKVLGKWHYRNAADIADYKFKFE